MAKVTDYVVAVGGYLGELSDGVVVFIGEGFQPWGSLCVNNDPDGNEFWYQAMVKYA